MRVWEEGKKSNSTGKREVAEVAEVRTRDA